MNDQDSTHTKQSSSGCRPQTRARRRFHLLFAAGSSTSAARIPAAALLLVLFCAFELCARTHPPRRSSGEPSQEGAQQLVREVVWNEIQAQTHDHTHWRFHETQWKDTARKLYDVIQTKYGDLHRLIAINGRPLAGPALQAEDSRVEKLSTEPDEVAQAQKRRDADAKQELRLLRMLPHAFIFHEAGREGDIETLSFVPDPTFHPSSHEAEVFHHMEGKLLVNARLKRLVQIDGRLTSRVNFWGGLLGHLDKGGTFKVEQRDVADGHWDEVFLQVNMNGKALFFKTISVHQHEAYSDYRRVPDDMSLQQAARELKKDVESNDRVNGE